MHGHEETSYLIVGDAPFLAKFLAKLEPIGVRETGRVDGAVNDSKPFGSHLVMLLKVTLHHMAVDYNDGAVRSEILLFLQPQKGPMGQIALFHDARRGAHQRMTVLADIMHGRSGVKPSLRIQHVLAPGFIE